jgi:hypothetical protein
MLPPPEDPRWKALTSGYRLAYDPRSAIEALATPARRDSVWNELWRELHHQGDVGDASYVAIPLLTEVRSKDPDLGWQFYALCATIEIERWRKRNPPLPSWLAEDYEAAWRAILAFALSDLQVSTDRLMIQSALTAVAVARHEIKLGAMLAFLDESEIDEWVEENLAWSELYRPSV